MWSTLRYVDASVYVLMYIYIHLSPLFFHVSFQEKLIKEEEFLSFWETHVVLENGEKNDVAVNVASQVCHIHHLFLYVQVYRS